MKAKKPYKKRKKRLGNGPGSGHGKTSGKGQKGQKSRSGAKIRRGFEGGQNPLYRRLPKRGFNQASFQTAFAIINLGKLDAIKENEVSPEVLLSHGLMKKGLKFLKVLGNGEIKRSVTIKAHHFSAGAKEKIEKAGGRAITLERWPAAEKSTKPNE